MAWQVDRPKWTTLTGGRAVRVGGRFLRGSGLSPWDRMEELVEGRTVAAAPWGVLLLMSTKILVSVSGADTI